MFPCVGTLAFLTLLLSPGLLLWAALLLVAALPLWASLLSVPDQNLASPRMRTVPSENSSMNSSERS